jgi:hypothetical protein
MKKVILAAMILFPLNSFASCQCVCVEGQVQAICSNTLDVRPICAPRVCPIPPPSIQPIQQPRVTPVGTKSCTQKQVYNEESRRYEWKEICI